MKLRVATVLQTFCFSALLSRSETCLRRRTLRRPRAERGAALVEYAFILIIFLAVVFAIGGFGHALFVYQAVNNAAKEGTRWAAVNGKLCNDDLSCNGANGMNSGPASAAQIEAHVMANLPPSLESSKATATASFSAPAGSPDVCTVTIKDTTGANYGPAPNYPGCTVSVRLDYTYNFVFPLISTGPLNMSSTSQMIIVH